MLFHLRSTRMHERRECLLLPLSPTSARVRRLCTTRDKQKTGPTRNKKRTKWNAITCVSCTLCCRNSLCTTDGSRTVSLSFACVKHSARSLCIRRTDSWYIECVDSVRRTTGMLASPSKGESGDAISIDQRTPIAQSLSYSMNECLSDGFQICFVECRTHSKAHQRNDCNESM